MVLLFGSNRAWSQTVSSNVQTDGKTLNSIYTAVPFLLITPDARSGAMGDAGVAISPDANSIFWNPAKLVFAEERTGFSVSYTPWLRKLVPDINLSYLSFYHRLNNQNSLGFSLRHFSLGQITLMDGDENSSGEYHPAEMAFDVVFSRKLSERFSLGIAFRYINSNLNNGQFLESYEVKPVSTLAGDVAAYYTSHGRMFGSNSDLALGFYISNLGNTVNYQKNTIKSYLPANLKLGIATTLHHNLDRFTLTADLNKLLVPTNPERDISGRITKGKDPDRPLLSGIFGSFNDAPGGFTEELKEISYSLGAEYWIRDQFALRAGYFYEDPTKGNRKYMSAGIGIKYKERINVDLAYLIANQQTNPLAQTMRFTLLLNINKKSLGDTPEQLEAKRMQAIGTGKVLPDKALQVPEGVQKPIAISVKKTKKERRDEARATKRAAKMNKGAKSGAAPKKPTTAVNVKTEEKLNYQPKWRVHNE